MRASTLEGLKKQSGQKPGVKGNGAARPGDKAKMPGSSLSGGRPDGKRGAGNVNRPAGKKKPAAKSDKRPRESLTCG